MTGVQRSSFCIATVVMVSFHIVSLPFLAITLVAKLGLAFAAAPWSKTMSFAFGAIALVGSAILAKALALVAWIVVLALVVVGHIDRTSCGGMPFAATNCAAKSHRVLALAFVVFFMRWI